MRRIWTVGHGARPVQELVTMLQAAGIGLLADVRAYPASRRHPQFSAAPLRQALAAAGIAYRWEGRELGGFRKPRADSPNTALPEKGFRGYADHLLADAGQAALDRLAALAETAPLALMCAEREPGHCHRSLIADHLRARGFEVIHLLEAGCARLHRLHGSARALGRTLVYDGGAAQLPLLPAG